MKVNKDRSLLCSVRNVFGALISMSTLVGCNSQRDYTEYNYSELVASMKTVSLTASMIGKYKVVPDSDRKDCGSWICWRLYRK